MIVRFAAALFVLLLSGFTMLGLAIAVVKRLGHWNKTYENLGKRYGAKIHRGLLLGNPSMAFDYGRTFCVLKNLRSSRSRGREKTRLVMNWRDRDLRMVISTDGDASANWSNRRLYRVDLDLAEIGFPLVLLSKQPFEAKRLLTPGACWQIRQLKDLSPNFGVEIGIERGKLSITKPGYIKDYQQLDDFVRFGLELFDQFMLTISRGIEFVNSESANIVSDVKCPICSQQIVRDMVVCMRCKTPHCADCWEYNGQCATFACHETRFIRTGTAAPINQSNA